MISSMTDSERRSFLREGRRITVTEVGAGPILVCVPGGPGLPGTHLEGLGGLAESRTLIRPDWRGAGDSNPPADDRHRLVDYVEDLEALRAFLALEGFDLLGHSFGALVVTAYAAAHPTRVRRLVVDGPPDWRDKERILGIELPDHFAAWNDAARRYGAELQAQWYWPAINWFIENDFQTANPTADMAKVQAETLVLTGEHDPTFGEECAALLASYGARARSAVVPGAGHFTWFEQPDRYATLVREFLDEGHPS